MSRVPLTGIEVFLAIARQGSLRGAARELGLVPSAVSHQLKAFETRIGVDLFVRSTRSVELTAAGEALRDRADHAYADLAAAVDDAQRAGRSRTGRLRLTLPWSAYRIVILPVLDRFLRRFPEIDLDLSMEESLVDIVREGYHAGIRLGDRLTPGMVALRLTPPLRAAYSATPGYFRERGRPDHPRDLVEHTCIRYRFRSSNQLADWEFQDGGDVYAVEVGAPLAVDSFQAVAEAACAGYGIGWTLRAVVEDDLAAGRLETVLDRHTIVHPPFFLYFSEQGRRLDLLRAFADFIAEQRPILADPH